MKIGITIAFFVGLLFGIFCSAAVNAKQEKLDNQYEQLSIAFIEIINESKGAIVPLD